MSVRLSGRTFAGVSLSCVLWLAMLSCRNADIVSQAKNVGTVYDTANEKLLIRDDTPALLKGWEDDAPVYAEPVAIVGWNEGVSTWEVFYATNRALDASGSPEVRARHGNRLSDVPLYGRAEVTLPKRRRGVDVPHEQPKSLLPFGSNSEAASSPVDLSTIDDVRPLSTEEFLAGVRQQVDRSRQRDVLLFVHGFNVRFDASVVRAAQIALDMPFNGAVLAYSWPSQGGVQNYAVDEPINAASVAPFQEFLTTLRSGLDPDVRIHILVHSMGNRIVMQGLSTWNVPESAPQPPIDNLALMAPDVGLSDFRACAPGVVERCRRVTLYASVHDAALIASKNLHQEQRAGDAHPPVICAGIETIDCSAVDITSLMGHSYYSANVAVLSDLFQTIKRDRPAAERPHLKSKKTADGVCYRWTTSSPRDLWTWHFEHLATDVIQNAGHTTQETTLQ